MKASRVNRREMLARLVVPHIERTLRGSSRAPRKRVTFPLLSFDSLHAAVLFVSFSLSLFSRFLLFPKVDEKHRERIRCRETRTSGTNMGE